MIQKYQRPLLISLTVICMGIMALGAVVYLERIKDKLKDNTIQDVMDVTIQQRQAFENFVSGDRERLHSYATHFAELEGMTEEQLEFFRGLSGKGLWDNYTGIFTGVLMFGYYETFTFENGHRGLVQKAYERSRVLETFTLSIYDGQGFGCILNPQGDILLRSVWRSDSQTYDNIFDALTNAHTSQADIDTFRASLEARETGGIVFQGDAGDYIYTFAPIESMNGWHILSSVPMNAIQDEANGILRDSQMAIGFFALMLVISSVFILLVWHTQKEIKAKEQETACQSQLFDLSFTYLAQNTDDMYMILNHETEKLEYVSPNLERVPGVTPEELIDYFRAADVSTEDASAYHTKVKALRPGEMAEP